VNHAKNLDAITADVISVNKKVAARVKKIWFRIVGRDLRYSSDYEKLDRIYMVGDPWRMASPSEEYRLAETNRIILGNFGRVGSLLEIGCGEGHQSLKLREVCGRLIGLDVSTRAVERARRRFPGGEFFVADIFSQEVGAQAPFDLVVACEVLYYMSDVAAALRRMRELGRSGLVTYFAGEMENLDTQVLSLPGAASEILEFEGARWRAVWWRSEQI
jgi:SAM-dependent methyltransferase